MISQRTFYVPRNNILKDYTLQVRSSILDIDNPLTNYLRWLLDEDNDISHEFLSTEMRPKVSASQSKPLCLECSVIPDSFLVELAKRSEYAGWASKQHELLQTYFLKHVDMCIGVEIPVWNDTHCGHIDLIAVDHDGTVFIWDLKPSSHKEKPEKVLAQLWHYRNMLSERTGIARQNIECSYFDNQNEFKLITK